MQCSLDWRWMECAYHLWAGQCSTLQCRLFRGFIPLRALRAECMEVHGEYQLTHRCRHSVWCAEEPRSFQGCVGVQQHLCCMETRCNTVGSFPLHPLELQTPGMLWVTGVAGLADMLLRCRRSSFPRLCPHHLAMSCQRHSVVCGRGSWRRC